MTPSFFKKGLAYFGALIVGGGLTVLGMLSAQSVSSPTGEFGVLTATSTARLEQASVTSTLSVGGTAYLENAFVTSTFEVAGQAAFAGSVIRPGSESLTVLYGADSLDFAALTDGTCEDKSIAVQGVSVSTTNPFVVSWGTDEGFHAVVPSSTVRAYVSGADTVTVKNCATGGDTLNPNDYVFTIRAEQLQSEG